MRKTIMFLLIIFFITGCENGTDYILEIQPDIINETAFITLNEDDYDKANYLNDIFTISTDHFNDEKESGNAIIEKIKTEESNATYKKEDIFQKKIENNKITLNYSYDNDNFGISKIFNSCFNKTIYDSTEEYYAIKGYNQFKCLYKDEIKVVIKTDYKVIDSNADEKNNNEYIWYFNEDNYLEHELYIQVSKQLKPKSSSSWKIYVIIGIAIVFIIYKFLGKRSIFPTINNNDV